MDYIEILNGIKDRVYDLNGHYLHEIELVPFVGKEHFMLPVDFRTHMDYRVFKEEYIEKAITVLARSKETKELVGYCTSYILPRDSYRYYDGWKYKEGDSCLNRFYLSEYEDKIGELLLLMAFGTIIENSDFAKLAFYKWILFRCYINIIMSIDSISVLAEPRGLFELDANMLRKSSLSVSELKDSEKIGQVYPESVPAYKLTKHIGLTKQEGLYHNMTLGSLYFRYA